MMQLTLEQARQRLAEGGLIIYPTETFFGIGCRVDREDALARIFQVKRRLLAMPLPLILSSREQLDQVAQIGPGLKDIVDALAARFWPGPLTLIVPARKHISPLLTGGTGNIAVRVSPHPVAAALAQNGPLVSSSANISGKAAAAKAEDIDPELAEAVGAVVNLPPAPFGGMASTIVEPLADETLRLHRVGALGMEQLKEAGFILA